MPNVRARLWRMLRCAGIKTRPGFGGGDRRIYKAVIAARDAGMILVARNQQNGVLVAIGKHSLGCDLSAIIDANGSWNKHTRAKRNQRVQVHDGTAVLPKEPVQVVEVVVKRSSHDLTSRINAVRLAVGIVANGLEIGNDSISPENRMECVTGLGKADH